MISLVPVVYLSEELICHVTSSFKTDNYFLNSNKFINASMDMFYVDYCASRGLFMNFLDFEMEKLYKGEACFIR